METGLYGYKLSLAYISDNVDHSCIRSTFDPLDAQCSR